MSYHAKYDIKSVPESVLCSNFHELEVCHVAKRSAAFNKETDRWDYWPSTPATHDLFVLVSSRGEDIILYKTPIDWEAVDKRNEQYQREWSKKFNLWTPEKTTL